MLDLDQARISECSDSSTLLGVQRFGEHKKDPYPVLQESQDIIYRYALAPY
jgi:hypothetical protein